MKRLSALWMVIGLALSAWSCDDKVVNPAPGRVLQQGWRPAEIPLTEQELKDGGIGEVVTMGPWVLAMAGYGNLYLGKEGDPVWRKVAVPDSEPVSRIQTTSEGVFLCGVVNTGRVYTLNPLTGAWVDLGFPRQDSMRVRGLVAWQGRYVAFLSRLYGNAKPVISFSLTVGDQKNIDQGWKSPNTVTTVFGLDTILLAATFDDGIYRYTVGDPVWRKLPPTYYQSTALGAMETRRPRAFAFLNGTWWVGQLIRGLYSTANLDSAIKPYPPPDTLNGRTIPLDVLALLVWRGRLFISGYYPDQPMVLDPATNVLKPVKGNFCRDAYGEWVCDYSTTWELAATTDTLYAASGGRLFKISYNDIPQ